MDIIHTLFQDVILNFKCFDSLELSQNLIKWKISRIGYSIELHVFKRINDSDQWNLICTKNENFTNEFGGNYLLGIKLIDNSGIMILTTKGLSIHHFNENNESISLNYYYFMG